MSGREAPRMRGFTPGVERARRLAVDAAAGEALAFAEEPLRISAEDFRAMAVSCAESGASDITIQTGQQPRVELDGVLHRLTRRPWAPSEVETVLAEIYGGANAIAEIGGAARPRLLLRAAPSRRSAPALPLQRRRRSGPRPPWRGDHDAGAAAHHAGRRGAGTP